MKGLLSSLGQILFSPTKIFDHLHSSLMFCGTGLQYFILFSAFYKKTYRFWDFARNFVCPFLKWPFIQRKPKSTSANGEKTPTISENGTKKAPVCKEEEKKLSDTEDLLEDLGRATDKVKEMAKDLDLYFQLQLFPKYSQIQFHLYSYLLLIKL